MSLNNDFNLRRLERYLTVAWDSGAMPIIVLTKKDLCSNVEEKIAEVKNIASNIDIITTSNNDSETINALKKYISIGKSVVFVGSSGVGKSTLINLIAGHDLIKTKEIRKDDRGRHTTTNRQLLILPMGGIVIDTPGLREIQIETGDIGRSFEDIKALIQNCKFKNCTHQNEPGCAIRKAIEKGIIDSKRYNNYLKLSKEINYESLNSKEIENEKIKNMFGSKTNYKKMINEVKKKNKRY
jgi:ribosome biogenesis GTPase